MFHAQSTSKERKREAAPTYIPPEKKNKTGLSSCGSFAQKRHKTGIYRCGSFAEKRHKTGIYRCGSFAEKTHKTGISSCGSFAEKRHKTGMYGCGSLVISPPTSSLLLPSTVYNTKQYNTVQYTNTLLILKKTIQLSASDK